MPLYIDSNASLPRFRNDLRLYKGPPDHDGSPTYNLFDPLIGQYYKISWQQSLILKHLTPGISLNELVREINLHTTEKITPEDVKVFFEDAFRFNFLEIRKDSSQLIKEVQSSKINYWKSIFYRYLYFRVPLLKPDEFLTKTLPYVMPFVSLPALILYAILGLSGIVLLISRFGEYIHTFTYFFNFNGFISYLVGLIFFKLIHEFAHAYTAKYYNVHIPSMGVAFVFFAPVLYTDATDGWKLSSRNNRLKISAAGIISELILASICTLGWALSSPGVFQSVFFVISSIVWISSLLINLNPAMRFDGYYLLSDFLGIDNLQSRAFNLTRWWVHHSLLGMDIPCPEEKLSRKTMIFMVIYSFYTWIYRLFLYLSISLFLYVVNVKFKILGVFLFIATIFLFIIFPLFSELKVLWKMKSLVKKKGNFALLLSLFFLFGFWLIFPLPHSVKFSAVAVPIEKQNIYIPSESQVKIINVKRGDRVKPGQHLIQLFSEPLSSKIADYRVRKRILESEVSRLELSEKKLPFIKEKSRELESINNQLVALNNLEKKLNIFSSIEGELIFWDNDLKKGQYVNEGMLIGTIAQPAFKIIAFVPEEKIEHIVLHEKAEFFSRRSFMTYEGQISAISPVPTNYLDYPALASINHGDLPVVGTTNQPDSKHLKLLDSLFVIEVSLETPKESSLRFGEIGTVKVRGPWDSYLVSFFKTLTKIFWRESGL